MARRMWSFATGALTWALAAGLLSASPTSAHVAWNDGTPVPDWVGRACCGPGDAHLLGSDQVHRVPDGYRIDGYPGLIYDSQVLPSEDGQFWAFYSTYTDASGQRAFTSVFCFFAPTLG